MRDKHRERLQAKDADISEPRLLDLLFRRPLTNTALVAQTLEITDVTAGKLLDGLAMQNLLEQITGLRRNRVFRYTSCWQLFQDHDGADDSALTRVT